jgi:hypothetical protein
LTQARGIYRRYGAPSKPKAPAPEPVLPDKPDPVMDFAKALKAMEGPDPFLEIAKALHALATREMPAPIVNVAAPVVNVSPPEVHVHPAITVSAPTVEVTVPKVSAPDVVVKAPEVNITNQPPAVKLMPSPARAMTASVVRDSKGLITDIEIRSPE